jgi:uncharacterized protein (DUF305 family)
MVRMSNFVRYAAAAVVCAGITAAPLAAAPAALAAQASAVPEATVVSAVQQDDDQGQDQDQEMLDMAREYADGLRDLSGGEFEQTFMVGMIAHHEAAVEMARIVLDRGKHEQLKDVAQQIIDAQTQEIDDMTGWLQSWYGLTVSEAQQRVPDSLRTLQIEMDDEASHMVHELSEVPAGDDTDRAFMEAMIVHHRMAIIEARPVPDRATHEKLATTAEQMIDSQGQEIEQFRTWLEDWYGETS